jgi:[ribosomal protein S18]-alanine N-acetyltransferase
LNDLRIRAATAADAERLADIHRAAFPLGEAWSADVMLLHLRMATTIGLLHDADGMILARVAADEAEILSLAVAPVARRHGIGSALLRSAIARVAAWGAERMFLEVSVTNEAALALYAANGFTRAGLRRRYYADGTDALVMCRAIDV